MIVKGFSNSYVKASHHSIAHSDSSNNLSAKRLICSSELYLIDRYSYNASTRSLSLDKTMESYFQISIVYFPSETSVISLLASL